MVAGPQRLGQILPAQPLYRNGRCVPAAGDQIVRRAQLPGGGPLLRSRPPQKSGCLPVPDPAGQRLTAPALRHLLLEEGLQHLQGFLCFSAHAAGIGFRPGQIPLAALLSGDRRRRLRDGRRGSLRNRHTGVWFLRKRVRTGGDPLPDPVIHAIVIGGGGILPAVKGCGFHSNSLLY